MLRYELCHVVEAALLTVRKRTLTELFLSRPPERSTATFRFDGALRSISSTEREFAALRFLLLRVGER
jgi:hypothetical protein